MREFTIGDRVRIVRGPGPSKDDQAGRTGVIIHGPLGVLAIRVDAEPGETKPTGGRSYCRGGRGGYVAGLAGFELELYRVQSTPVTTTVDIVIRLQVVGEPGDVERCRGALECLADVMAVQAEDGLWSRGLPDIDGSELIADVKSTRVQAVLISPLDPLIDDLSGRES